MRSGRLAGLLLTLAALMALSSPAPAQEASHRCEDYETQDAAQAAFDRDPARYRELDDDEDGIACEHLPRSTEDGNAMPWIAGGLIAAAAAVAFRRRLRPVPASPPPVLHPEYDPEVEMELELIKAEQARGDAGTHGKEKPPAPDEPGPGGVGRPRG